MLASAYAHELPRYGLEVGLTNYAAGKYSTCTRCCGLAFLCNAFRHLLCCLTFVDGYMNWFCSILYWASSCKKGLEDA